MAITQNLSLATWWTTNYHALLDYSCTAYEWQESSIWSFRAMLRLRSHQVACNTGEAFIGIAKNALFFNPIGFCFVFIVVLRFFCFVLFPENNISPIVPSGTTCQEWSPMTFWKARKKLEDKPCSYCTSEPIPYMLLLLITVSLWQRWFIFHLLFPNPLMQTIWEK